MELSKMRRSIDRLDWELLHLLSRRMEHAVRTKRFKTQVADGQREEEILSRVAGLARGLISESFATHLMTRVLEESRKLQEGNAFLLGFKGEHGSYGEIAALVHNPDGIGIPFREYSELIEGLRAGSIDSALFPIDNSLEGGVDQTEELLIDTDLHVVGEVVLPVEHALLTLKETDYRDIRNVYSHPEVLAQCHGFVRRNRLDPRPWADSAGAALMLVRELPVATAVIAHPQCAKLYDLEIIKDRIADAPEQFSRYLVLARDAYQGRGDKCSVVFTTDHRAGALLEALRIFSDAGINLTRIESRSLSTGKIAFLLDFLGSSEDRAVVQAIESLRSRSGAVRLLGCYVAHSG